MATYSFDLYRGQSGTQATSGIVLITDNGEWEGPRISFFPPVITCHGHPNRGSYLRNFALWLLDVAKDIGHPRAAPQSYPVDADVWLPTPQRSSLGRDFGDVGGTPMPEQPCICPGVQA